MNLLQRAKSIWPGLSATEMDTVLWACTTYPTGHEEDILADLKAAYVKSGGDVWQALNQADEARSQGMMKSGG